MVKVQFPNVCMRKWSITHFVSGIQVKLQRGWLFVTLYSGESSLTLPWAGGWARWPPQVPCNRNYPVIMSWTEPINWYFCCYCFCGLLHPYWNFSIFLLQSIWEGAHQAAHNQFLVHIAVHLLWSAFLWEKGKTWNICFKVMVIWKMFQELGFWRHWQRYLKTICSTASLIGVTCCGWG